jgi:hypothetical protein
MPRCFYHRLTTFTSTTRYGYFLPGSSRELRGVVYPYERPGSAIDPGVKSTGFFMMRLTSTVSLLDTCRCRCKREHAGILQLGIKGLAPVTCTACLHDTIAPFDGLMT